MIRIHVHIERIEPSGNTFLFIVPQPEEEEPNIHEKCCFKLLGSGFTLMQERLNAHLMRAQMSGGSAMLTDPAQIRRQADRLRNPALILSFIHTEANGTLYTAMAPTPIPDNRHSDVKELYRWVKETADFVSDRLFDDGPYDDPQAFQTRMLAALGTHLDGIPAPAFLPPKLSQTHSQ